MSRERAPSEPAAPEGAGVARGSQPATRLPVRWRPVEARAKSAPVEPAPSPWQLPDPSLRFAGDVIAVGGDLAPGTLLAAYRAGMFPMGLSPAETMVESVAGEPEPIGWWCPNPRGVLPLEGLVVSRSLRRSLRRYELRLDTSFVAVVMACADPSRTGAWITPAFQQAYTRLHELGWAHSIEAWESDRLVGGLYGVAIGGLFAGESMFATATDASKVALVGLVDLLRADGGVGRLLDVQWSTDHLASLGCVDIPRRAYLRALRKALRCSLPPAFGEASEAAPAVR